MLIEPKTGDVILARRPYAEHSIASTTKMMTALVTIGRASLQRTFTATNYVAQPAESVIGLRAGERMKVSDLVRGLLVASANDAAATLAVDIAGSRKKFVKLMNDQARKLGLHHTHYANPVGLDEPGNYSTVADLIKLALVLRRHAFLRETTNMGHVTLQSGDHPRPLTNVNDLLNKVSYINGVKTGHTQDAGYCLVGSATRDGITVDQCRPRRPLGGRARQRHARAAALRVVPVPRRPPGQEGRHVRPRDAELPRVDGPARRLADRRAHRRAQRGRSRRRSSERRRTSPARCPPARTSARSRFASAGGSWPASALVTRDEIPAATFTQKVSYNARHHKGVVLAGAAVLAGV